MSKLPERISLGLVFLWVGLMIVTLVVRVDITWWNAALLHGLLAFHNFTNYHTDRRDREIREELLSPDFFGRNRRV